MLKVRRIVHMLHQDTPDANKDLPEKKVLLAWIPIDAIEVTESTKEVDGGLPTTPPQAKPTQPPSDPLPESEVYLRLLLIHFLQDKEEYRPKAMQLAHETVEKIRAWNRRSMDPLAARVWFALGRAYELSGELENVRP